MHERKKKAEKKEMIDLLIVGYVSMATIVIGVNIVLQIKDWMGK